jgi:hypothetical protein
MSVRNTLIALSAVAALGIMGAATTARASDHEDQSGGFRIGPLGQLMGTPSEWGTRGASAYGFVSPSPKHVPARKKAQSHE